MKTKLFATILAVGTLVSAGVAGAARPYAPGGTHYFVHRSSVDSHTHLIMPGEWAGQTFQATTSEIGGVWILSDVDPATITVEIVEFGSQNLVGTGTSYRKAGNGIRVNFATPLIVNEGIYYLLRITSTAALAVSYSNYDDYPIGDGRLHNTGTCCLHGDDLNARIIG